MNLDAPGSGPFEVWGELDGKLYRYCSSLEEAQEHVARLQGYDSDNSWSGRPQTYRISPNDGNGRCPGCGDPTPSAFPPNSPCDDHRSCAEPPS